MTLVISHEVQVIESSGTSKKKRNRSVKKVINKAVNVVEAAAKFCTEYAQGSDSERSPLPFLHRHEDALRRILGISLVFKFLTSQFLSKNFVNGQVLDVTNMERLGLKCGLSELIPGRSSQIRSLSGTVLRMKENAYSKINVGARTRDDGLIDGDNGTSARRSGGNSPMEIQPSNISGVFAI